MSQSRKSNYYDVSQNSFQITYDVNCSWATFLLRKPAFFFFFSKQLCQCKCDKNRGRGEELLEMGFDHSYCTHLHLPKTWITVLYKALVTALISVQTLSVRLSDLTCDWYMVTNMLHHIEPNQATWFDCRFTSREWYLICYPTYITSNAKRAHLSVLASLFWLLLFWGP